MKLVTASSPLRHISKDGSHHVTNEVINTVICVLSLLATIVGTGYLILTSIAAHKPWHIFAFSIYGLGVGTLFLFSTLHHGLDGTQEEEERFRLLDYLAIYTMIGGSMTPFCLLVVRNTVTWSVFGTAWVLAVLGIALKLTFPGIPKLVTTTLYLVMGWLGIFLVLPISSQLGWAPIGWLVASGLLYSFGALIFMIERPNPIPGWFGFHEIWHLFVLAATICNYVIMAVYLQPLP